ncbi:6-phosphogluconolactonase [Carboxylicivirga mesophila]|uniref:6-phosphogluconolactonase n=1 Tax=Carboxylicivirga mesophila TaxID=1166478 RepID=A0ABS5KF16_9BACT|nr:6-phosphogluconolactonase [Carboxylicivirga mesophila]MBS2213645.1 6-phosphogluconolactonase [Carboxylicivirga mesophila]
MHKIFESKQAIGRYLGDYLLNITQEKGEVYIALSGGSTPKAIFELLAKEYAKSIDWSKIVFFWGDERCVPPTDSESNFRMTREHLFDHVDTRAINIFRVKGELDPEEAVEDYIETIDEQVPVVNGLPQFDIMLLGMGDDGHTASIFPHQIKLWESNNICELAQHPDSGQFRVTLTGNVINNSQQIFFLVTGENKAEKVDEIFNKKGNYKQYPAALVDSTKTEWLLDNAAANLLK